MHAMQGWRELLLIRRIPSGVVGRRGLVVDFAQRDAVAAPAALERTVVHVIDQDAFCIDDIQLVRILIQIEEENSARKGVGILVVLPQGGGRLSRLDGGSAMPEVP